MIFGLVTEEDMSRNYQAKCPKVIIARELKNPELLIASQPTRGVDIGAINSFTMPLSILLKAGKQYYLFRTK